MVPAVKPKEESLVRRKSLGSPTSSSSSKLRSWPVWIRLRLTSPHELCEICLESVPGGYFFCIEPCGHRVCISCALQYVREALSNRGERFVHGGLPCYLGRRACDSMLHYDQFLKLQDQAQLLGFQAFTDQELTHLERCGVDAGVRRGNKCIDCPVCELPSLLPKYIEESKQAGQTKSLEESRGPRVRCPHCRVEFCRDCACRWHYGMSCTQHRQRLRDNQEHEVLDREYIEATSKPCPSCQLPTSRYHGHGCHHVGDTAQGGCIRCGCHWCYACGATEAENLKVRGRRSRCRCPQGSWSAFCVAVDIKNHIAVYPYPHDTRCGCMLCPECDPIRGPCAQCDGTCVVCLGLVEPVGNGLSLEANPIRKAFSFFNACYCTGGADALANYQP